MNDEQEQELDMEIKREREREYVGDYNEEMMIIWIRDNKESLMSDFCSGNDDFDTYCRDEYNRIEE